MLLPSDLLGHSNNFSLISEVLCWLLSIFFSVLYFQFSYITLDWASLSLSCLTFTQLLESVGLCLLYESGVFQPPAFWGPHCVACRILVPQPGIKSMPPAVEAWSLNHWSAREIPSHYFFECFFTTALFFQNSSDMNVRSPIVGPRRPLKRSLSLFLKYTFLCCSGRAFLFFSLPMH